MVAVAEQVLNGLQFGITLFLMAAGLTLIFGVMNLVNLAHGSLYMMGAFIAAAAFNTTHSFLAAVGAALIGTAAVGIAIEIIVFRTLYRRDHLDQVLSTFGLILFFNEIVRMIWGATALYAQVPSFLTGQVELLPGAPYPTYRLAIIAVGLIVGALIYFLVMRTRIGMLIRAGAFNRIMVGALGVNITLLYTLVFGLGAALAGLSGALAGPIFTVESGMGDDLLILAFVVIVIGGIGSIRGAFIAAILVGVVDTIGRAFLRPVFALFMSGPAADNAGPATASMLIYILMATVLFFRPQGLFPLPVLATFPAREAVRVEGKGMVAAAVLIALALLPPVSAALGQDFYVDVFTRIMIFAIAALSLDLILGYGGMVSFGHAAYLGIGSYAVGILSYYDFGNGFLHFGVAILASALVALFIGWVSLRTSGVYFIMITLAFGQMIYFLGESVNQFGGDNGLNIPHHSDFAGLIDLDNATMLYYFVFAWLVLFLVLGWRLVGSRFGMVIQGAKSNERRMLALGFPSFRYKLVAFIVSGAMAGVAGALLANLTLYLSPNIMHWTRSGEIMMMVILGGMGTLIGPVIGAVVYLLLENLLSGFTEHWQAILGPFLVLVVIFSKSGLLGAAARWRRRPKSSPA